ncbi:hypothetical protein NDU88_006949 [Pleurodeles waltl]|uniref:Uncharacterized protein n=1 Tax=Pleurodeles waltl TaxID=8319 RepID=A0AAV7U0W7_PLEWA|nr:hypothetical protein NDU88_006949 [Pleurodeles waltl]
MLVMQINKYWHQLPVVSTVIVGEGEGRRVCTAEEGRPPWRRRRRCIEPLVFQEGCPGSLLPGPEAAPAPAGDRRRAALPSQQSGAAHGRLDQSLQQALRL